VLGVFSVTFGTAERGLDGLAPAQYTYHCTKHNSPSMRDQCTNLIWSFGTTMRGY